MNNLNNVYQPIFSYRLPDGSQVINCTNDQGTGFKIKPLRFTKPNKELSVFVTHGPIKFHDIKALINRFDSRLKGRVVVLSGTHGEEAGKTVLDDITLAHQKFYEDDKWMTGLILINGAIIRVLNLADFREEGKFCRMLEKLKPETLVLNFCHGDRAMEYPDGQLPREIKRVFGDLVSTKQELKFKRLD